ARFGHEASSQTECRPFLRIAALIPWMRDESAGSLIFIHSGFLNSASRSVTTFLTGIRAILSASRYLTPRSITMGLLIACVFQLRNSRKAFQFKGMLYLAAIFERTIDIIALILSIKQPVMSTNCKIVVVLCPLSLRRAE